MAVEKSTKQPELMNRFWPKFIKKQITITVIYNIILSSAFFIFSLSIIDTTGFNLFIFSVSTFVFLIASIAISTIIIHKTADPTKTLLAAIISISGERSDLKPPNPNNLMADEAALSDALKTIYNLAANESPDSKIEDKSSNDSFIKTALDMSKCGFVAMDGNRKIIYSNPTAPISIAENGEQQLNLIFNGDDNLNIWLDKCAKNSLRDEHVWTRVPDRLPNEEDRRFFDVIASYRKDLTPEVVLTLVDRTANYSVDEEDLDFIAFAAHELRGPITVIKGYTDILEDELSDSLQGDQKELFKRLVISSNRLSSYVDNILNTSRYDRRHLKIHMAEDTVANIYNLIADDMKLRASSQNRLLSVNIPETLPTIAVDKASMSEVFGNLIDNAIKYSNEGGVINVSATTNGDFVDFSVQDNGIGMPESVIKNLFKKFYRSHRSRETVAGTGIGLYISKAIVESHGGNISVRSQDGHGSTFTVSIPIYSTVADKLKSDHNSNEGMISEGSGWISNHSMYRG